MYLAYQQIYFVRWYFDIFIISLVLFDRTFYCYVYLFKWQLMVNDLINIISFVFGLFSCILNILICPIFLYVYQRTYFQKPSQTVLTLFIEHLNLFTFFMLYMFYMFYSIRIFVLSYSNIDCCPRVC